MNNIIVDKDKLMDDIFYKDGYTLGILSRDKKDTIRNKIIFFTEDTQLSNKELEIVKFNFIKEIASEKDYNLIHGLDNVISRFYFMIGLIDGVTEYIS